MKDWKIYLKDFLNRSVIHFIDLHFRSRGIKDPSIEQICQITEEEMLNSWLSIKSIKDLLLLQQQLKDKN